MSKKRKTRKQKERAIKHKENLHTSTDIPLYSIDIKTKKTPVMKVEKAEKSEISSKKEKSYLKHDIGVITSASGIVIALDFLLYTLLSRGIIRLPMFGY